MSILRSYRDVKVRFIRHYGVIPVIEVLEAASDDLLATVLRLVNQVRAGDRCCHCSVDCCLWLRK